MSVKETFDGDAVIDGRKQLSNVLAGLTADGAPLAEPILLPATDQDLLGDLLTFLFRDLAALIPRQKEDDFLRTGIIFSFLWWLTSAHALAPNRLKRLARGVKADTNFSQPARN